MLSRPTGVFSTDVAYCLNFIHYLTPLYHQEANPEERRNRDLKTQHSILVERDHTRWKDALPAIRFAMNTTVHAATEYTPAYVRVGRGLLTPHDVEIVLRTIVSIETSITEVTAHLKLLASTLKEAHRNH